MDKEQDYIKQQEDFDYKRYKHDLVKTKEYLGVRQEQLNLILDLAAKNYDATEIRGMLKLIAKTDNWEDDFNKILRSKK